MKSIAVLAAACALLASGTISTLASPHPARSGSATVHGWVFPVILPSYGRMQLHRMVIPLQTAPGTDTPTPLPSPSPIATTTPISTGPDPVTILQNMYNVLGLIKTVHFEELADQQGAEVLNVDALGDASCTGPSLKAHVSAKASVSGTLQSQTKSFDVIRVKSSIFWKSKSTKKKWQPAKTTQVQPFGFDVQDPLPCPNATTGGGTSGGTTGGPTDTIKDLINKGQEQYAGQAVWHIHATDVSVDPTTSTTTEYPLDWYVDTKHSLLFGYVLSFTDTANHISGSLTTKLSKFGEKFKVSKPKKGASKP